MNPISFSCINLWIERHIDRPRSSQKTDTTDASARSHATVKDLGPRDRVNGAHSGVVDQDIPVICATRFE